MKETQKKLKDIPISEYDISQSCLKHIWFDKYHHLLKNIVISFHNKGCFYKKWQPSGSQLCCFLLYPALNCKNCASFNIRLVQSDGKLNNPEHYFIPIKFSNQRIKKCASARSATRSKMAKVGQNYFFFQHNWMKLKRNSKISLYLSLIYQKHVLNTFGLIYISPNTKKNS